MEAVEFTDQYELAARLYGVSADELRAADKRRPQPLRRWLVVDDDVAIGAVNAVSRPDDRVFLHFVGDGRDMYLPLTSAATDALQQRVHTFVDADDHGAIEGLQSAGFVSEMVEERFRVRFDLAIAHLRRAWLPSGFAIHSAETVDHERLFALDNALRQDTPGTDGWRGDRVSFRAELAESPPFDPNAYLVAVDTRTGEYAGLVRIWRNPKGPRFGLIGVRRHYRATPLAAVLMREALSSASQWGHQTFTAEASTTNRIIYERMSRVGAESLGQFFQMARA